MYVYKKEAVAAKILPPETRRGVEDTLLRFCHFGGAERLPGFVNGKKEKEKEKEKEKVEPCGTVPAAHVGIPNQSFQTRNVGFSST